MRNIKLKKLLIDIKESIPAYILIAPTIAVFIIFLYIPLVNAFKISLFDFKGYGSMDKFVGLENYKYVIGDRVFWNSVGHTITLIGFDLLLSITIGFLLAYALFRGIKGKRVFHVAFFIPYLISMVVVGCIWKIIYDPMIGPLNQILGMLGLDSLRHSWLSEQGTALGSIIVTWIWRTIPFNMLILYANIMSLPTDYLEAAELDGASAWQRIRYVILPYLAPTFITLAILTITNDLRAFDMVWTMTKGGPGGATEVITSYVYRKAFSSQRFGIASTASIIMMAMMIVITAISQLTKRREKE